jgi:serine protease Do
MTLSRFVFGGSLALLVGCAGSHLQVNVPSNAAEWGKGTTDIRKVTALVRVTPPVRLQKSFETVAARTADPDLADFLRGHALGGFGSGFLMTHTSSEGTAAFIVTNRHVIAESERAEVSFTDGMTYKDCEVVYSSPKADLAVIALPESAARAVGAGLRPSVHDATDRESVVATGYPGVGGHPSYQVTDGKISNAKFSLPEVGMDETYVQHTAPIDPGSSGGPLTDESGALVGVNVSLMRSRTSMFFAVPSSAVVETVRHAHDLVAKKKNAQWMTAELDKRCSSFASEVAANSKSYGRLFSFVSNAAIADRGLESYGMLLHSPVAANVERDFFQDPIETLRESVGIRLTVRAAQGGGATGMCASANAIDADSIAEGKPVRRGLVTKNGGSMEVLWTFEHGTWRIAGGEMVDVPTVAEREAPAPVQAKKTAVKGGR